jgi:hypothetical protein
VTYRSLAVPGGVFSRGGGDYWVVVLWASGQAADAAASVVGPILMPDSVQAKASPSIHLFDHYEPGKERLSDPSSD